MNSGSVKSVTQCRFFWLIFVAVIRIDLSDTLQHVSLMHFKNQGM